MEGLFRFSDYDVFGYLASGLIILAIWDIVQDSHIVLNPDWTASWVVFVIISGYVVGHIVGEVAALIFDRCLVRGITGKPSDHVMRKTPPGWRARWYHYLFGEYFIPLNSNVRDRVIKRAGLNPEEADGNPDLGETLFWRAWPIIKRDPIPYARMDSFLKLYGFCRNLSFVSLVAAAAFGIDAAIRQCQGLELSGQRAWWAVMALITSIVMFGRYLKFMKLYVVEVFSTYAESARSADE